MLRVLGSGPNFGCFADGVCVWGGSGLMRLFVCVIIYGFRVRNKNKNKLFGAVCSEVG